MFFFCASFKNIVKYFFPPKNLLVANMIEDQVFSMVVNLDRYSCALVVKLGHESKSFKTVEMDIGTGQSL